MAGKRLLAGRVALFLLLVLGLAGCRKVEFADIHRVAVLAPDNRTSCRTLPEEIKAEVLRLLSTRLAGEAVDGAMIEAELPAGEYASALLDPVRASALGARYGVDAFLVGTVTNYREEVKKNLQLETGAGEGLKAEIRVDLAVTVGFNLTLIRAEDGGVVFSRYAEATAVHPLTIGLAPPSISLNLSAEPIYPRLRQEAIRKALEGLLRKAGRRA